MSFSSLAQGRIFGEMQTRPTKTGGRVTFFKMKVTNGNATDFLNVSTFSDTVREELSGLSDGDAISVVGELTAELFEWKGSQRIGLRLTADRAMALKLKPAKPKASPARQSQENAPSVGARSLAAASWAAPSTGGDFDDSDIPF
jgi:single-stranded DNA-binding protein